MKRALVVLSLLVYGTPPVKGAAPERATLPEGDAGIAARYPRDHGIATAPGVLFADDFESYATSADLSARWDVVYQRSNVGLTRARDHVFAGSQALEMTLPPSTSEVANAVDRILRVQQDVVFLRYYARFASSFDVTGSSHNGASVSSRYYVDGRATPGVPADGKNKFLVNLESWRADATVPSPGRLNVYVYHPEQRDAYGDHFFPDGTVLPRSFQPGSFGPAFVKRPDVVTALDRWYCHELMVKANTPGRRDGRIAVWLNGKLVADFGNLRLRDVPGLKIDRVGLDLHARANAGRAAKWYDDVVAATSYIGPMKP